MKVCREMSLLHPLVKGKTLEMVKILDSEKLYFAPFETFRSPLRQFNLWAQGRLHPGRQVTKVPIGFHCFGLAVDFVMFDPITRAFSGTYSWKYEGNEKKWERLGEIGEQVGFFWGGRWKPNIDRPHFQLTGNYTINNILYSKVVPYDDLEYVDEMVGYKKFLDRVVNYSIMIMNDINNNYDLYKTE